MVKTFYFYQLFVYKKQKIYIHVEHFITDNKIEFRSLQQLRIPILYKMSIALDKNDNIYK